MTNSNRNPFSFGASTTTSSHHQPNHSRPNTAKMHPFATEAISKVNSIADRMRLLQAQEDDLVRDECQRRPEKVVHGEPSSSSVDDEEESSDLIAKSILVDIIGLREGVLSHVSTRLKGRLLAESKASHFGCNTNPAPEFAILYGRCFNLSMNLKILSQCSGMDLVLAKRILSDLSVLESSLESREDEKGQIRSEKVVSSLMNGLNVTGGDGRPRIGFL